MTLHVPVGITSELQIEILHFDLTGCVLLHLNICYYTTTCTHKGRVSSQVRQIHEKDILSLKAIYFFGNQCISFMHIQILVEECA